MSCTSLKHWLHCVLPILVSIFGTVQKVHALPTSFVDQSPTYSVVTGTQPFSTIFGTPGSARLNLSGDDLISAPIALPFPFFFRPGQASNTIRISTNGIVTFGSSSAFVNRSLPAPDMDNTALGLWDDLWVISDTGRGIETKTIGVAPFRTFVVEFHRPHHYNLSDTSLQVTFQIRISEGTGVIEYHYGDVDFGNSTGPYDGGASATIGVQIDSIDYLQYSLNERTLRSDDFIRFDRNAVPARVVATTPGASTANGPRSTVSFRFNVGVNVDVSKVSLLRGTQDITTQATFTYNPLTLTGELAFPSNLSAGSYTLTLFESITDSVNGLALDGNADNIPGGNFVAPFTINITGIGVEQPSGTGLTDGVSSVGFGTISVGASVPRTFVIRNLGGSSLTDLAARIDGANAAEFVVGAFSARPLVAGATTTFTVNFVPGGEGARAAVLHIDSSDPDRSPFDIVLGGTGTPPAPVIAVEQPVGFRLVARIDSVGFGSATLGGGRSLTFRVKNIGVGPLSRMVARVDGTNASDFSANASGLTGASLASGESADFTVTFAPGGLGPRNALLHIDSNDASRPVFDIDLTGAGVFAVGGSTVGRPTWRRPNTNGILAPSALSDTATAVPYDVVQFSVATGGAYTLRSIANNPSGMATCVFLYGDGFSDSTPLSNVLIGSHDFPSSGPGTAGFTYNLAPGRTYYLVTTGALNTDAGAFAVQMDGPGILVPSVPDISVEPTTGGALEDGVGSVNCGAPAVGLGVTRSYTIRNTGVATMTGISIVSDGLNQTDFAVGVPGSTTLAPAGSTTFTVLFTPSAVGLRSAAIHVRSNVAGARASFDIALTGAGVALPVVSSPTNNGAFGTTAGFTFTLPAAARAGTVRAFFNDSSGASWILALAGSLETVGPHSFNFDPRNPVTSAAISDGKPIPDGAYTVTLQYQDELGNFATSANINNVVIDTTGPVLTLPADFVREATSANGASVNYTATASDPSAPVQVIGTPVSGAVFPLGETTVNVTATDNLGNASSGSFKVTVRDTTRPAAIAPMPLQTVENVPCPDFRPLLIRSDSVGVTGVVQTPAAGALLPLGIQTVSFAVSDAAGNTATVQSRLTVAYPRPTGTLVAVQAGRSGAEVPSAPPSGATFKSFGTPAISDLRHLAAKVTMSHERLSFGGIYLENFAGVGNLLAFQGGAVPGVTGAQFKAFLDPLVAPGGAVAFSATVKGSGLAGTEDSGVWSTAFGGALQLVLREGGQAPGLPDGVLLASFPSLSLRDGELLALVTLSPKAGVVTKTNNVALLRVTGPGAATVLLRKGDPLTVGSKPPSAIKTISVLAPAPASAGQGRWHGDSGVVAKVTLADTRTVLVKVTADGAKTTILATGDPVANSTWSRFGLPCVGGAGTNFPIAGAIRPAPGLVTKNDDSALAFSPDGAAFSIFAREGDEAPEAEPAVYSSFFDPVGNDAGDVAFFGTLRGSGVKPANRAGIWWGTPSARLELVARLGKPATGPTGAPQSGLSGLVWTAFSEQVLPDGPSSGPIFRGTLAGQGVGPGNNSGLWAVDSTGAVRLILRTGDPITVGGGEKKLKSFALFNPVPGSFGARRSYNATGSIAVLATFTDTTQALMRIDVP